MKDVDLWHGDCLDLLGRLPEKSVQLFLCDLPYATSDRSCTANHWDKPIDLLSLWNILKSKGKKNAAYVFFSNATLASRLMQTSTVPFMYDVVWVKNRYAGFLQAERQPLRGHEWILIFGGKGTPYHPPKVANASAGLTLTVGKSVQSRNYGTLPTRHTVKNWGHARSVLRFDRDDVRDGNGHPTQKPVSLLEWIVKTYTAPHDLVVDPTAGSMSTAVAAKKCRRRVVCIEKDNHWYQVGRRRVFQMPPQSTPSSPV